MRCGGKERERGLPVNPFMSQNELPKYRKWRISINPLRHREASRLYPYPCLDVDSMSQKRAFPCAVN